MSTITYASTDLSNYNLSITTPDIQVFTQLVGTTQLKHRQYAHSPVIKGRSISLDYMVTGSSASDLLTNIDAIKGILFGHTSEQALVSSLMSSRTFGAICTKFDGEYITNTVFSGSIDFVCPSPYSYSSLNTQNETITTDPQSVTITMTGNALSYPIITITNDGVNTISGFTLTTVY